MFNPMFLISTDKKGQLPGIFYIYLVILFAIFGLIVINFEVNFIWLKNFANRLRVRAIDYQMAQTHRVAEMMEKSAENENNDINNLSYDLAVIDLEKGKTDMLLENFLKNHNHTREISLVDLDGREIKNYSRGSDSTKARIRDFAFLDPFEKAKNGEIFFSHVDYTSFAEPYIMIGTPVKMSGESQPKAVLISYFYLRGMWEIALETKIGNSGRISVIDDKGILIADPKPSRVLKKLNLMNLPPTIHILRGEECPGARYLNENKTEVIGVGVPIKLGIMKWGVIVEQYASEVEASLNEVSYWLLMILGGNLAVILILVYLAIAIRRANKELIRRFYLSESEREKAIVEKNKTSAIISNFVDPVLVFNNEWRLALFNDSARKILGLTEQDLNKHIPINSEYFPLSDLKKFIKADFVSNIIEKDQYGLPIVEEATINFNPSTGKSSKKLSAFNSAGPGIGNNRIYKVLTAKITDSQDRWLGYMKIFYDITREKLVDQLKSEFISIAAHQLRTPLSSIKWVIKMVLDGDAGSITEEQKELLNKGYISNERVIGLVNDLLNVSRIEDGQFGFEYQKINLGVIMEPIIKNIEETAERSKIHFSKTLPPVWPTINADKEKIVLAFQSILDNAVKYTPEYGKMELNIAISEKSVIIKVHDSGVGIPAEDQARLFSKFFRGSNVVRMQTEGSGLGLFITKNIINTHQGEIILKSEEGKGTEVEVVLPIVND
jgi:signal transduction histidine kinase